MTAYTQDQIAQGIIAELDVPPILAVNNTSNVSAGAAELLHQVPDGNARRNKPSDLDNIRLSQAGIPMPDTTRDSRLPLTSRLTSPGCHIGQVFSLGAYQQVPRLNTWRVVTGMSNNQVGANRPVEQPVTDSVSEVSVNRTVHHLSDISVPAQVPMACPQPAPIWGRFVRHKTKKLGGQNIRTFIHTPILAGAA